MGLHMRTPLYDPYGSHTDNTLSCLCGSHMGYKWAAHKACYGQPIWDPYESRLHSPCGTHMGLLSGKWFDSVLVTDNGKGDNKYKLVITSFSSTHACTKSGFILEDSTNSTTRRNRSPIYFYTRLVRQRHYFGNLLSKVQLLKKLEQSPEVQRVVDMISIVSSTKT